MPFARRLLLVMALIFVHNLVHAQSSAVLIGTVVDEAGAVSPGAAITAIELSSGLHYTGTSDEKGTFRISDIQPGSYRVQVTQAGFATVLVPSLQLLVGQTVTLPVLLKPASVAQSVQVDEQAELINTETQEVGGNIDRKQMDNIPLLGRNWQDLSLLVKGITANDVGNNSAGAARDDLFQLNLDGQQITQGISIAASFGEPHLSRDAIAEYQIITNMYDITQGRSLGEQVNAISRSGTNTMHGTVYGNFRRDQFNAADFVAKSVLPYQDTILGGTLGGPITKNRLHYFGAYEHESTPSTVFVAPPQYIGLPAGESSLSLPTPENQYNLLVRGDYTINDRNGVNVRLTFWNDHAIVCACQTSYPTSETQVHTYTPSVNATWTSTINPNTVQEVKAGYFEYFWKTNLGPGVAATPGWNFGSGLTVGPSFFYPESFKESVPTIRYDLTSQKGRHTLKFGAETLFRTDTGNWPVDSRGQIYMGDPTDVSETTRFPLAAWNDPAQWNTSNLSPISFVATQDFFPTGPGLNMPRKTFAIWAGDAWHPTSKLVINAGLRWDADLGQYDPPGFKSTTAIVDNGWGTNGNVGNVTGFKSLHDFAPRLGASYALGHDWVLRAGGGVFYSVHDSQLTLGLAQQGGENIFANTYVNLGQTDFFTNWAHGHNAAYYAANPAAAGPQAITSIQSDFSDPRAVQGSVGLQKQIGSSWVADGDLTYSKGEHLA